MEQSSRFGLTQCPLCRAECSAKNLNRHLTQVHLRGHSELLMDFLKALATDPQGETLKCVHCDVVTKKGKLPGHFLRVHLALYPNSLVLRLFRAANPNVVVNAKPQVRTILSSVVDSQTGMANIELSKFADFLKASRLEANSVERCVCRKVVVFVEIEPGKLKAFDIDHRRRLTNLHLCDGPKSESIYAFSGGAIDSNRRKH
jgi:hypothetical protein